MRIVERIADLDHPAGISTGFVPTMGALHEGHLSLVRKARLENERVLVSLFVNPSQFSGNEDFDKYPRDLGRDAELLRGASVDVLFAPSIREVYPRDGSTVNVPTVTDLWEGAIRPGHFTGVATIVAKLFNIVRPDVAYFGLKDLQQCMVVERMVQDLNMPIRLSFEPTVREPDGLAMSSRNTYLSPSDRAVAPKIYEMLCRARSSIYNNAPPAAVTESATSSLRSAGFQVDYFELVELPDMRAAKQAGSRSALIAACRIGGTRLIDNVLLTPPVA